MKGRREIRREDEFVETVGGSGKWKANAEGEWETDACEATAARLKGEPCSESNNRRAGGSR